MKEYRKINDLPIELRDEIKNNSSFFDDFEGKSLDEQQRIACVLNDCDLEIIAGAGTGKTQTLISKASYLIEKKDIKDSEILCLSFSRSCVKDLRERLKHTIETRTLHSLGLSIISKYTDQHVFEEENFYEFFEEYLQKASPKYLSDIMDYCEEYLLKAQFKDKLMEIEYEEEKLDFLISNTYIVNDLKQFINLFKGQDYDVEDLRDFKRKCEEDLEGSEYFYKNMKFLQIADNVFRYYQSFLNRNQMIDFNDMINKAIHFIEEYGFDENYKYIFVDEYQDMSHKNFQLLKAIKEKTNANLVVVGDDWQSIYGFRDSDLNLFTNFDEYFPNAKRVFIEKTYRSPQQLIDIAGNFIMKNENQFKKSLQSEESVENPVKIIYHSINSEKENSTIYNLIYNLSKDNDILILGRHRKDIDKFLNETELVKKGRSRNHKRITDKFENIENVEFRTIHKAKGLEADYAIIIQAIDDWLGFPNKLSPSYFMTRIQNWDKSDKDDEERRLFYVALTRAKKGVYIFTSLFNESKYVDEIMEDNPNSLEIIHSNDIKSFSHLKEFSQAPKPEKKLDLNEFEENSLYDPKDIEKKFALKNIGNQLMKSKEYDEAENFYKKLKTNMLYLNDYYPYRKLVTVYEKKKEPQNVIKTIDEFFRSERYCRESQLLWFKLKFKKACKHLGNNFSAYEDYYGKSLTSKFITQNNDFSAFEDYLDYFTEHGMKNKDKQNMPVPIAARIQKKGLMPEKEFEESSKINELKYNYKFARKYESSAKTLYYLEQLWNQKGFNKNLTAYKRLCGLYDKTGQYDKVIETAEEYFNSNAKRTKSSPDWFMNKIKKAQSKLDK